jgi:hypothetical protein
VTLAGCILQTGAAQRRSPGHLAVTAACRAVRVADASCAVEAGSGTTVDRVEMNGVRITNRGDSDGAPSPVPESLLQLWHTRRLVRPSNCVLSRNLLALVNHLSQA